MKHVKTENSACTSCIHRGFLASCDDFYVKWRPNLLIESEVGCNALCNGKVSRLWRCSEALCMHTISDTAHSGISKRSVRLKEARSFQCTTYCRAWRAKKRSCINGVYLQYYFFNASVSGFWCVDRSLKVIFIKYKVLESFRFSFIDCLLPLVGVEYKKVVLPIYNSTKVIITDFLDNPYMRGVT